MYRKVRIDQRTHIVIVFSMFIPKLSKVEQGHGERGKDTFLLCLCYVHNVLQI